MQQNVISALAMSAKPGYIKNYDNFEPGKDTVLYSGPYWDHQEIAVAINSIVNGAWITTGEKVAEFQDQFAKMFQVKHAHMVNSGSSANLVPPPTSNIVSDNVSIMCFILKRQSRIVLGDWFKL